ncbi:MAG: M13 family metallopeptidase [Anaeromyxobacter sp.]
MRRALALVTLAALAAGLAACHRTRPRAGESYPALDEAALDRSIEPCDDFYQFACGGWLSTTAVPPDRSTWSRGRSELEERSLRQLRRLLDDAAAGKGDPRDHGLRKLGDAYASCMDEPAVEARGLVDLRAEWARLDAVPDRDALAEELGRLMSSDVPGPLSAAAGLDPRDPSQLSLVLSPAGLELQRDTYLSASPQPTELRARYAAHLRTLYLLAGLGAAEADQEASRALRLETALAEALPAPGAPGAAQRLDRAGLERLAPGLAWGRLLERLGLPQPRAVSVTAQAYTARVATLVARGALEDWRAYLRWRITAAAADAGALPAAFLQERLAFRSAPGRAAEPPPRWRRCVLATGAALGPALGQAWLRRYPVDEARDRAARLVVELEAALQRDMEDLAWMDGPSRSRAQDKLVRLTVSVGAPPVAPDPGGLRIERESWLRNWMTAARAAHRHELAQVGRPVDRAALRPPPPSLEAYHDPLLNELVCPPALLQPPFFNRGAPEAVNYGALGSVLAAALIHAVDEGGRERDGEGMPRDGWTAETARRYAERAACVERQFSAYQAAPGVPLDGARTRRENVADLAGVKLAYAAWAEARGSAPEAEYKLLGFTPEQQFFLGYAQSICTASRDPAAELARAQAPARTRVNGPLSNLAEFSAAFSCRDGSPMVRPDPARCEVW